MSLSGSGLVADRVLALCRVRLVFEDRNMRAYISVVGYVRWLCSRSSDVFRTLQVRLLSSKVYTMRCGFECVILAGVIAWCCPVRVALRVSLLEIGVEELVESG